MFQKGLTPIVIILILAAAICGYLIYSGKINLPQKQTQISKSDASPAPNGTGETANWKIYEDWYSARFSFKYPDGWSLHTEGGTIVEGKTLKESLKNFPSESYSDEYVMIKGKEVLIRDVINAGPAYGRVLEAYIPYETSSYIWLTGRKVGLENRKATDAEIKEFINIVSTLNIKPQN